MSLCCRVSESAQGTSAGLRSWFVPQPSTGSLWSDGMASSWPTLPITSVTCCGHQSFEETSETQRCSSSGDQHNSAPLYKFSFPTATDVVHFEGSPNWKLTGSKKRRCFKINFVIPFRYYFWREEEGGTWGGILVGWFLNTFFPLLSQFRYEKHKKQWGNKASTVISLSYCTPFKIIRIAPALLELVCVRLEPGFTALF